MAVGGFAAPRFLSGFTRSSLGELRRSGLAGAGPSSRRESLRPSGQCRPLVLLECLRPSSMAGVACGIPRKNILPQNQYRHQTCLAGSAGFWSAAACGRLMGWTPQCGIGIFLHFHRAYPAMRGQRYGVGGTASARAGLRRKSDSKLPHSKTLRASSPGFL